MEENKNSLLGLDPELDSNTVNGIPYLISLPEENETIESQNTVIIEEKQKSDQVESKAQTTQTIKTESQNKIQGTPSAPSFLQSNEEYDNNQKTPSFLQSNEEYDKNKEVPYLLEKPVDAVKAESPIKFNFEETQEEDTAVTQKLKSSKSMSQTIEQLSDNEKKLKDIESKFLEKTQKENEKNLALQNYLSIKAGFESVQKVLEYQKQNSNKPDFDDQHYTVPENQSLFNLTVNQISNIPHWRGR